MIAIVFLNMARENSDSESILSHSSISFVLKIISVLSKKERIMYVHNFYPRQAEGFSSCEHERTFTGVFRARHERDEISHIC